MNNTYKPGVAVRCTTCGPNAGSQDSRGRLHCGDCGAFAESAPEYCIQHDIDYRGLYKYDNHCPACREEQDVRDMMMHEATRDPLVEPW